MRAQKKRTKEERAGLGGRSRGGYASRPETAARYLVDLGFTENYEYALQAMKEIPYRRWREYSAEDSVRFWALRLHENGFVKSSPNKIIGDGTDWRFLNELKQELKS